MKYVSRYFSILSFYRRGGKVITKYVLVQKEAGSNVTIYLRDTLMLWTPLLSSCTRPQSSIS